MPRAWWSATIGALALLVHLLIAPAAPAAAVTHTSAAAVAPMTADQLYLQWAAYGDAGGHWTGGDSTVSVPLPDGRIAWLYSDTFLGTVRADHSRPTTTPLVNNSLVVQNGTTLGPTLHGGTATAPTALVRPGSGSEFYWVGDGTVEGNTLKVLYGRFAPTGEGPPLGFTRTGTVLATFSLPSLTLTATQVLPVSATIGWGSTILEDGSYSYIYGSEYADGLKYLHLARVATGNLAGAWEFWTGSGWSSQETASASVTTTLDSLAGDVSAASASSRLLSGVGEGMSLTKVGNQYVLVTQENNQIFSSWIVAYVANSPAGPFTGPTYLLEALEPSLAPNQFIYHGRIHPEFSAPGKLLLTYDVNTFDPNGTYADARIYRPRFHEVTWPPPVPDPATVPGAPTGLTAVANGDGSATLTWTAPAGSNLNYWIYRRDVTAGQTALTRMGPPAETASYEDAGLIDGHTYAYQVSAVTLAGVEGPQTPVVAVGGRRQIPAAPAALRATAGTASDVTLTWNPSDSSATYRVYALDITAGETLFTEWATADPYATTATVNGLIGGHTYEFKVTAANAVGESPPSNLVRATAYLAPPPAPAGLSATAQPDGSVGLTWNAAARATTYWIHRRNSTTGETAFTRLDLPISETSANIDHLVNGNTYEFKVSAEGDGGQGPAGNVVTVTSLVAPPAAPTGLAATPQSDGTVALTWTAAAGAHAYWVYRRDVTAGHTTFSRADAPVAASPTTVGSLYNGNTYEFKVAAIGDGGEGPASGGVSAVARVTPPAAPTALTATSGDKLVQLAWTAPVGAPMFWIYQRDVTAGATTFTKLAYPVEGTALTVQPLMNGHAYEFKVAGINEAGEGPQSGAVQATPMPPLPPKVTGLTAAAQADGTIKLAWTGLPEVYYWVYHRDVSAGQTTYTKFTYPAIAASAHLGPFTAGHTYDFKVAAYNLTGEGPASDPVRITAQGAAAGSSPSMLATSPGRGRPDAMPESAAAPSAVAGTSAVPSPPRNLRITGYGDGYVDLAWDGSPPGTVFYWVYFRSHGASDWQWFAFYYPTLETTARLTTPLWNDFKYDFRVTAHNEDGLSGASNVVTGGPASVAPAPPSNLRIYPDGDPGVHGVDLVWDASPTPNVFYYVHFKSAGTSTWYYFSYPAVNTWAELTYPLWPNFAYDFRVVAVNRWGSSSASNTVRGGPEIEVPRPPGELKTSNRLGGVFLDWEPSKTKDVLYWIYFNRHGSGGAYYRSKYPTASTSFLLTLLPEGAYNFSISAANSAGERKSEQSETGVVLIPPKDKFRSLTKIGHDGFEAWLAFRISLPLHAAYPIFNWETNGCNIVPDRIRAWVFGDAVYIHEACWRHDFAIRTLNRLDMPDYNNKLHADRMFLADLLWECDVQSDGWHTTVCRAIARKYFDCVRNPTVSCVFSSFAVTQREGEEPLLARKRA